MPSSAVGSTRDSPAAMRSNQERLVKFDEYRSHDAVGLAALVARGEVSAEELLGAARQRMCDVNELINAITVDLSDSARAAAGGGLPKGPLTGVPFLIKDISAQIEGVRTTAGSRVFADSEPAAADSAVVASYRSAGLNLLGKTNTPEFGLAPVTEPVLTGPSRNPWNLERTPGGSSGGSAAAVASGIVPAAHASDGGGSIRIPASCCGLVGLKPSRGRVSQSPAGEGWGGLTVQHAVTRSVRDSALLLDIACGPRTGDPYALPRPATPFLDEVTREPGKLRIAFTTGNLMLDGSDPASVAAVERTVRLCQDLGHEVEEAKPEVEYDEMSQALGLLVGASIGATLENEAERRGLPIRKGEVENLTWVLYCNALGRRCYEVMQAQMAVNTFARRWAGFFERYDAFILPTLGEQPIPIGHLDTTAADLSPYVERISRFIPNTQPFNVGGQPSMSLPMHWSDEGLPIGVQIAARLGAEATLFRLAGQLEAAAPWFDRTPPL
jgi:amidase